MKSSTKVKKAKKKVAKKKAAKKRAPRKVVVQGAYVATIEVNEQVFTGSGDTALEACTNLVVPPLMLKTKCFLRLTHADLSSEQMFLAIQLRRFINGKVARAIWAKRLEERLK